MFVVNTVARKVNGLEGKGETTFEEYYERYYSQVYKYILKKILDVSLAEDLAMDAFVSCYQRFDDFDETKASFGTWIYVIVNNKLKNYYRDRKIAEELNESAELLVHFEDELIASEYLSAMRNELAGALNSLPEVQRSIVIHKYFDNKNANEIAQIVGLTPVNVRVQLSRALQKLKDYFTKKNIKWEN